MYCLLELTQVFPNMSLEISVESSSLKIYLFTYLRVTEREIASSFILWFTSQKAAMARAKTGSRNFIWVFHMNGWDPNTWSMYRCFSQVISTEQHLYQNSKGCEPQPCGMPASQAQGLYVLHHNPHLRKLTLNYNHCISDHEILM